MDLDGRTFPGRDALARLQRRYRPAAPRRAGAGRQARAARRISDVSPAARRVGEVTSGTFSPTLERPIAMGYVAAGTSPQPGTEVAIDIRGRPEPARSSCCPFIAASYLSRQSTMQPTRSLT